MSLCNRRLITGIESSRAGISHVLLQQSPRKFVEITPSRINRPRKIVIGCWRSPQVKVVASLRSGLGSGGDDEKQGVKPCSYALGDDLEIEVPSSRSRNRTVDVMIAVVATVVFGVANRVLYKLALIPLKHYPFFLAQFATFGYVIVYFSILYLRYHAGIVTREMLSLPKSRLVTVGLLEALGAAAGMAAGGNLHLIPFTFALLYGMIKFLSTCSMLSGASIPILSQLNFLLMLLQTFLVWQIILSIIFLGRRYRVNQLLGCFLVAIGVIVTVASPYDFIGLPSMYSASPLLRVLVTSSDVTAHIVFYAYMCSGSDAGLTVKEAGIFWSLLMIVSFLFQAADTVLKEMIFLDAAKQLKGGSMDLFVVNSFGSAFQALFICLLLPFLSKLWGVPFSNLPNYLKDGAACFLNVGSLSSGMFWFFLYNPARSDRV
ncbi:Chloroquine-resistance transporter-like [Dillenia turbinata]|uniref:Chloroquine-resistance transporter-like n=1 Tax=Dillenia turbinata TaxID=194707 RepID=A0AAN8ZP42_9MAGN